MLSSTSKLTLLVATYSNEKVSSTLSIREDECVMFLKARKGVVKLALQHGVPIVPVITFGLRNAFTAYIPKGSFWASIGRKLGYISSIAYH